MWVTVRQIKSDFYLYRFGNILLRKDKNANENYESDTYNDFVLTKLEGILNKYFSK